MSADTVGALLREELFSLQAGAETIEARSVTKELVSDYKNADNQ